MKNPKHVRCKSRKYCLFINRIKATCKQVTVSPGKQKVRSGCTLSCTGQCYGSGQEFPGNVFVVWHTFIHGGFKSPGVLKPTAPAQLPRVQESSAACFEDARTVTTDNDREDAYHMAGYLLIVPIRWLSSNGFTTLKTSGNHYIKDDFLLRNISDKNTGLCIRLPFGGTPPLHHHYTEVAPKIPASWGLAGIAATATRDQAHANYMNI